MAKIRAESKFGKTFVKKWPVWWFRLIFLKIDVFFMKIGDYFEKNGRGHHKGPFLTKILPNLKSGYTPVADFGFIFLLI